MGRQVMNPNFFKKKTVAAPAAAVEVLSEETVREPEKQPEPAAVQAPKPQPPQPKPAPQPPAPKPAAPQPAPQTRPAPPQGRAPGQGQQKIMKTGPRPQRPPQQPVSRPQQPAPKPQPPVEEAPEKVMIRLGHRTSIAMKEAAAALREINQPKLADAMEKIPKDIVRDRFTVAVVGEFSRGKSTFLNRLLGKEVLPVGDMPTTALPARIRHNAKEVLVAFDEAGRKRKAVPLSEDAWDGLLIDNFGGVDPKGSVLVGVQSPWLLRNGIELMDTPGAGDLEEERTRVISDALLGADGAIIAISATLPLSMSEKFFIEQRLIARKTPYMMIIITKMDQIPVSRRPDMIRYIKEKLEQWGMNIPVFVPYDMEMPNDECAAITGMDKVKRQVERWVFDPERVKLTESWAAVKAVEVLDAGISSLQERSCILNADEDKRLALIQEKKRQLTKAQTTWGDLRVQMRQRCDACYEKLQERANDYVTTITERLQYEASHAANPPKWWSEDYPYRLKVELTNMSVGLNDTASRVITEDTAWFNRSLDRCFKTFVLVEKTAITDKNQFANLPLNQQVQLESLDQKRSAARVAISAASIAGTVALNLMGMGFLSILATSGVSTGASLFTDHLFKQKVEKQREEIKRAIGQSVPQQIQQAVTESRSRIRQIYDDVLAEAMEKEKSWLEAQNAAIESGLQGQESDQRAKLNAQLERLENARDRLLKI